MGKEHKKESLLMRLKIIENKNKKQLNEIEYQIKKQLDMIDSNREKQFKTIKETRQASKTCCTKKWLLLEKIEKEEKELGEIIKILLKKESISLKKLPLMKVWKATRFFLKKTGDPIINSFNFLKKFGTLYDLLINFLNKRIITFIAVKEQEEKKGKVNELKFRLVRQKYYKH